MSGAIEVKERPIIFSGPMARAILEERKSQTRRVIKPQEFCARFELQEGWPEPGQCWIPTSNSGKVGIFKKIFHRCPYGQPGDRLWVQESFRVVAGHHEHPKFTEARKVRYMASDEKSDWLALPESHWHLPTSELRQKINPGRFMPRWASRIQLEVMDVRVERLTDISDDDAIEEGIIYDDNCIVDIKNYGNGPVEIMGERYFYEGGPDEGFAYAEEAFYDLWDSINGNRKDKNGTRLPYASKDDPWVWVVEFRRINS